VAASGNANRALAAYRQRWTIETLFANLKTKGFNLEDTRLTDPGKLSTLLAVLALTVTLCINTGVAAARLRPIPIKKHGRRAWSLFDFGIGVFRKSRTSNRLCPTAPIPETFRQPIEIHGRLKPSRVRWLMAQTAVGTCTNPSRSGHFP